MDHDRTLLVEAGAGSGKTALMAGRVVFLLSAGVHPKGIVAITFTEAAASELLERIEDFVQRLLGGDVPIELSEAIPEGLTDRQRENLRRAAEALDEITCTTIHGFCQQLIKPYPVETGIDPGAAIIDPAAAQLAYQDLMEAWLSARFGRDRRADGLGRIPAIPGAGGEDDFFAELLFQVPDETLELISNTAQFLKLHRTAQAPPARIDPGVFAQFADAVARFASWYAACEVVEPTTGELIDDLNRLAALTRDVDTDRLTGRRIAELLFHTKPNACKKDEMKFKQWGRKAKWKDAGRTAGRSAAYGEQMSAAGEAHYRTCGEAYEAICAALGALAFQRFVAEFGALRDLYQDYKRNAALLDFDDLLHYARDLLKNHEEVRQALAHRYPLILVDEFQDTDPLQAEILWRLASEGDPGAPWYERTILPGALFVVGDPKQAIYRFRGADVETYLVAKRALTQRNPTAIVEIPSNFRAQPPILNFVNRHFAALLDPAQGQPGFTALTAVRASGSEPGVLAFEIALDQRHKNSRGNLVADLVRREEGTIVADIAQRLIGNFPVWDKEERRYRSARAGDIALLAPTGTSLWIYEREFESREIPIATQAGKGFFRRQEVQDLIAVARAVADRRDTLALGAVIRGPLVGLTEEEIANEIDVLQREGGQCLNLWTDPAIIDHEVLKQTLTVLQNIARKVRQTTPYHLLAEAVEELHVRPILKARHPRGAERALANVELVLEMARAYAGRGIADFARALWQRWEDQDAQAEGRPDAGADAVSIITIHSAKGLEWPIVIPINSTTSLRTDMTFVYRRRDDIVHFRVFDYPSPDYEAVCEEEREALRRERVRLWYVALTRARDLLLLPRQSERIPDDWFSLMNLDINDLPPFDCARFTGLTPEPAPRSNNNQDIATWQREAATIAATERQISWHQPSRREEPSSRTESKDEVFVGTQPMLETLPAEAQGTLIQGGRERGSVMHKLMEEVLTGELSDNAADLQARAAELLMQLGVPDVEDPTKGLSSYEMSAAVQRALRLPEIATLRPKLLPEFRVYAGGVSDQSVSLTAGIADAVASEAGRIEAVIDWKSDVNSTPADIEIYRGQVRDYLTATGAEFGLIVFLTSGRIERVEFSK